jgi:hypothetical protein
MKYCNATKTGTQEVHNNELIVDSIHDSFDSALAASGKNPRIIEVSDDVKVGDSIDENGKKWVSSFENEVKK